MSLAYLKNLVQLLKTFNKTNCPYFFISGGALRDCYEGRKPSDYDIFSPEPNEVFELLTQALGEVKDTETHWFFYWGKSQVTLEKEPCSNPKTIWDQTDFIDCCASYDSNFNIEKHEDWDNVIENKQIVYTGQTRNKEATLVRCMLRLNSGYTITSEECEKLFDEPQALWQSTKFDTKDMIDRKKLYYEIINSRS